MIGNMKPVKPFNEGLRLDLNNVKYTIGRDYVEEALVDLLQRNKILALDIETMSVLSFQGNLRIKTVTIGNDREVVILDPRDPYQAELVKNAVKFLSGIILHNATFDLPSLYLNGLVEISDTEKVIDTIVYARLGDPKESDDYSGGNKQRHDLSALSEKHLHRKTIKSHQNTLRDIVGAKNKSDMYDVIDVHVPSFVFGAADDVVVTYALLKILRDVAYDRIVNHPFGKLALSAGPEAIELLDREQKINRIFLRRTLKGLRVDEEYLDDYLAKHEQEQLQRLENLERYNIKPGKGSDLTNYLESIDAIPEDYPRTPTGKVSATAENLEIIDHPLVKDFVNHKKIDKILRDYLYKCRDMSAIDGRIHPSTNILGASASGRMSMGDPPLQQFPEDARGIVGADEGDQLVSIDWSQIEPSLLIYLAKDYDAILNYRSGQSDIYQMVAKEAGITRSEAKVVFLAHAYGRGARQLSQSLGISEDEANALKEKIDAAYPDSMRYARKTIRNQACKAKYKEPCPRGCHGTIYTVSGRILSVPEFKGQHKAYTAINYLIQGSAYDLLAESILKVAEAGLEDAIYMAIHDELVISKDAEEDIKKIMVTPPERLKMLTGTDPLLRVDSQFMGDRWMKV